MSGLRDTVKALRLPALALLLALAPGNAARAGILDLLPSSSDINKAKQVYEAGNQIAQATQKAAAELTPEQEYYLGRAVAADVMAVYEPYADPALSAYVNEVGQMLALASDRPQTFGGYHFAVLDSQEINAFAAPGGIIMVTRGMVDICGSEAELAAVLAHEIGHVELGHGVAAIKGSRWTELGGMLVDQGVRQFGGANLNRLSNLFSESVGDVTKTLMVSGYSRSQEFEADEAAVAIMERVGYPPHALRDMLGKMKQAYPMGAKGFMQTHPDPLDRIQEVDALVPAGAMPQAPAARTARFKRAVAGL